ncbi:molybdopterin-dependent oxidoreductase [Nesterenkonia halobia]|uniref:Molybdopterin-dependent oxidoreductase n=2 Tax=Nesterenkonia halobia TaxID=37922 RepID=A0ABP6RJ28_9MICC
MRGGALRHAVAGVLATVVFLGVADAAARFFAPAAAPLVALGSTVIEVTPPAVQDFAISTFGSANKTVLLIGMIVGGLLLAVVIGVVARRRLGLAAAVFTVVGAALATLVLRRPETDPVDVIPTFVGLAIGLTTLVLLSRRAGSGVVVEDDGEEGQPAPSRTARRAFLGLAGAATVIGAASLAFGRSVSIVGREIGGRAVRMVLPTPAVRAAAIPGGAAVDVDGVVPFLTPADDFYRIDTALVVPELLPEEWTLRITGMVEEEVEIDMAELLDLPMEERHITLACVSNPVGGELVGTATWLGHPVRRILERARPLPEADMVLSRSVDGFTASTPLKALTDDRGSLLAVGMNGEPLPREHGFPARLVVPGLYGFVSATKWVVELQVTRFDRETAYWTDRGWDAKAPILAASRIEVPDPLEEVPAGAVVVAGTAWAQQVGVARVEVRLDDGDWQEVELAEEVSIDTWRQWRHTFDDVAPGQHAVTVRAIDRAGTVQTAERTDPIPNAATGHHRITFTVADR